MNDIAVVRSEFGFLSANRSIVRTISPAFYNENKMNQKNAKDFYLYCINTIGKCLNQFLIT